MINLSIAVKAKLWDELKGDCDFKATHRDLAMVAEGPDRGKFYRTPAALGAQGLLDTMLQMETLAMLRPATPETFARVAADMRGDDLREPGMGEV